MIFQKTRERGLGWLVRRSVRELRVPETRTGKIVRTVNASMLQAAVTLIRPLLGRTGGGIELDRDCLYLFYDLEVAPVSYDFLWALIGAEIRRRERGLGKLKVAFVPSSGQRVRNESDVYEAAVPIEDRLHRVHSLLYPLATLMPSCVGISLLGSRDEATHLIRFRGINCYPDRYDPLFPLTPEYSDIIPHVRKGTPYQVLEVPEMVRRQVGQWLAKVSAGRKVVTITLRNYGYHPSRNSNRSAWAAVAKHLVERGYCVVVIPDTRESLDGDPIEFEGITHFPMAASNLYLRAALYDRAYLNLGVNGGPMHLAYLLKGCHYLAFKFVVRGVDLASEEYLAAQGFEIGASLPGTVAGQKWVWDNDDEDVIMAAFCEVEAALERT